MGFTELNGSDLIQMMNDRMGGYANSLTGDVMLDLLNDGKDEVWTILKSLNESYFHTNTQFTDSTQVNYFGPLNLTTRTYQLPVDFRAIRFIEETVSGFTSVRYQKSLMTDPVWQSARRSANDPSVQSTGSWVYHYDIVENPTGGWQMVFAEYPSTVLQPVLWYIRGIPDFEAGDSINQILRPFSKKIVNFAVKKALLVLQDQEMSEGWMADWKSDIVTIAQGGGQINQADPRFVTDYWGVD